MQVQVNRYVMVKKEDTINITDISLLTKEEYINNVEVISPIKENWWLRTASEGYVGDAYIIPCDDDYPEGFPVNQRVGIGVRPAVYCTDTFNVGDKIELGDQTYTAIEPHILLCDNIITEMAFRYDLSNITERTRRTINDYEYSDIKNYLKKMFYALFQ